MLHRRALLAASSSLLAAPLPALAAARHETKPASTFPPFIEGLKAEARKNGIKQATIDRAFRGITAPNMKVIELDRRQPEFTLTWDQYRAKVISDARIAKGKEMFRNNKALIDAICAKYKLAPGPLLGIWGLESGYGQFTGGFNVIEALATLAWEGRRASFFRVQLTHALKILDAGDIPPERMLGSYAGAMGQPQFMPDSFTRMAVDWDRDGKRDLWGSNGDILASVANYLSKSGWKPPLGWGQRIRLANGFDTSLTGREKRRAMVEWAGLGLKLPDPPPPDTQCAVVLPDGPEGAAFLVYHPNFQAIRRYNPSDYYALAVGLIGDAVVG